MTVNAELNSRIEEFVKVADEIMAAHWVDRGFTFSNPPKHRADFISDKWVRVVTLENDTVKNVYAFIVLQDGQTKTLGTLKAGDIHKPASFKAPAKHARGNVFDNDFRKSLTSYGPVYLK